MVHFLVRYPRSVYFCCMGNYFFSLVHSLWCLIQSWVNTSKTTLANVGSDESCTAMSAIMRLSVCFLFHRHSHIQFVCSPMDVNPEWLCSFWLDVIVDPKSPSTFLSLLMCSWPCVKDHPPSCLPRQFKKTIFLGKPEEFYGQGDDQILSWISGNVVFSQHTLTMHTLTLSIGRFLAS